MDKNEIIKRAEDIKKSVATRETDFGLSTVGLDDNGDFIHLNNHENISGQKLTIKEKEELVKRSYLYEEVLYALFRMDDKPHQSWSRLLEIAIREEEHDAIMTCTTMLGLSTTMPYLIAQADIDLEKLKESIVMSLDSYDFDISDEYVKASIGEIEKTKERLQKENNESY